MWSLLTNGGSKIFAVGQILWAGQAGGGGTLGLYAVGAALALLGVSVADFGFALESNRFVAMAEGRVDFRRLYRKFLFRTAGCFVLVLVGAAAYGALYGHISPAIAIAAAAYGTAYLAGHLLASLAHGLRMFREAAAVVGGVRATAVLFSGIAVFARADAALVLLVVAAVTEATIAVLLFSRVNGRRSLVDLPGGPLPTGGAAFGVAAIINTAVNRSDAALVGSVTTLGQVGTYGAASQVENAVTTVAVTPSSAIVTHAAQAAEAGGQVHALYRQALGASLALSVVLCVATAAATWLFLPALIGIPGVVAPTLVVLIGVPAGVAASVTLSHLSGLGKGRWIVGVWLVTAAVSVPVTLVLAGRLGAMGAAYAAVCRDVVLMSAASVAMAFVRRRS
jgi:O-antigen/teichoic acid export membrane protein